MSTVKVAPASAGPGPHATGWPVRQSVDSPHSGYFLWVQYFGSCCGPALKIPLIIVVGLLIFPFYAALAATGVQLALVVFLVLLPLITILGTYFRTYLPQHDLYTKALMHACPAIERAGPRTDRDRCLPGHSREMPCP